MAVNLQTLRDGLKLWRIDFRDQRGVRKWEYAPPDSTKTDAKNLLKQRRGEVAAGIYRDPKELSRDGLTFDTYAERFLEDYQGRRSIRSDYYLVQVAQLRAYWKGTPLADIDRLALDRYRRFLTGKKLAAETIRKRLVCLGTMLTTACDWGLLDNNPAWRMKKPPADSTPYRPLSGKEWGRLIRATTTADDRQDWELPLYRLALATAARRQEILTLRWGDNRDGFLYLHQGKTGRGKKVPVGDAAEAVFAELEPCRFRSPHVFAVLGSRPTRRRPRLKETWRPLNGNHVGKVFTDRLRVAGIKDNQDGRVSFHSLRSTAASWLAVEGFSELQIATLLGHKLSQTVTQRYVRFAEVPRQVVEALDRLSRGYETDTDIRPSEKGSA